MNITQRALAGVAPDRLNVAEIAILLGALDTGNMDQQAIQELDIACARRELVAESTHIDFRGNVHNDHVDFIVHRDNARRYFSSLGLEPQEGSPLWCWLRGRPAEDAGKLRADQQDKADFQQLCLEYWDRNRATRITGPEGVVNAVGGAYLRNYKRKTLEKWAREVAPKGVRGRRGRPKKSKRPQE